MAASLLFCISSEAYFKTFPFCLTPIIYQFWITLHLLRSKFQGLPILISFEANSNALQSCPTATITTSGSPFIYFEANSNALPYCFTAIFTTSISLLNSIESNKLLENDLLPSCQLEHLKMRFAVPQVCEIPPLNEAIHYKFQFLQPRHLSTLQPGLLHE